MGAMNIELAGRSTSRQSIVKLPVNLFAAVMGIAGLSLAWRSAHTLLGEVGLAFAEPIGALALLVFAALVVGYGTKLLRHPRAVRDEFAHPVSGNFFGTIAIGMLLLSVVVMPYGISAGIGLWTAGTVLTLVLGYVVVRRLLTVKQDPANTVPALIIPGVASLDIPVTGAHLPLGGIWHDLAWQADVVGLAIGTAMAVTFFVLIFARLSRHEPMPAAMTPSLLILMAPFEVGFLAYVNMMDGIDLFAGMLFFFGLFVFLVLAPSVFRRGVPFAAGWWAISFPLAALSIAAFRYAAHFQMMALNGLAVAILLFLTAVIAVLLVRTLAMLISGALLRV